MNYEKLEKDIFYVIKEQQIKIGYRSESVRLYYPLESLNNLLEMNLDIKGMYKALAGFGKYVYDKIGAIDITNNKDRFCLCLTNTASDYIHENTPTCGFLYDLIDIVAKHDISIEQIADVFRKYSDKVHFEKIEDNEFDYVLYFEDGEVDDSYFCFNVHENHIIYHRFTKEDYIELMY